MLGPAPLTDRQSARITAAPAAVRRSSSTPHVPPRSSSAPAAATRSATRRQPCVDRYRTAGARIFRTDEDGEVVVDTDGHRVVVWTWSGRREEFSGRQCHSGNGTRDTKTTKNTKDTKVTNELQSQGEDKWRGAEYRRSVQEVDQVGHQTIGCAITVHRFLGPGFKRAHLPAGAVPRTRIEQGIQFRM